MVPALPIGATSAPPSPISAGRVSSETSFVSKQPKLEPKLVSALSKTRRLLRLFRFNIKTGSFGVSKQLKQTKDQPKRQQICSNINLFNTPYHKFCLFWLFRYRSETSKQTEKKFFGFAKKQTEKQPNQIEFRFASVRTEKKFFAFEDPLVENVFWRFFRFVSRKFCLFRLFRYRSETPKQTEKMILVSQNKPKNNQNRLSLGLFRFEPKKNFDCFEDTLSAAHNAAPIILASVYSI
jgi:hypothetical protein